MSERETETEKQRETETERVRETHTETERDRDRDTERERTAFVIFLDQYTTPAICFPQQISSSFISIFFYPVIFVVTFACTCSFFRLSCDTHGEDLLHFPETYNAKAKCALTVLYI